MDKRYLITGSIFAVLAVVLGAFGAHALEGVLEANNRKETYDTAVQYHMFHALAILLVSLITKQKPHRLLNLSNVLFTIGIVVFSGSLYVLCITNQTFLGAITPIGGLCFIAGWLVLIYNLARNY